MVDHTTYKTLIYSYVVVVVSNVIKYFSPYQELTFEKDDIIFVLFFFFCYACKYADRIIAYLLASISRNQFWYLWSSNLDWYQIVCFWWSISIVMLALFFFTQFTDVTVNDQREKNEDGDSNENGHSSNNHKN